jgi:hypothetical protein
MSDDHVHELFWKNLPIDTPNNEGFLYKKIQKSFLRDVTEPFFIFSGTGKIKRLENFRLTEKQANRLRKRGLSIYLYEPLSLYKDFFNRSFYSEFRDNETNLRAIELDSISIFAEKYNLDITVYTGDYNMSCLSYPRLSLKCLDFFLRQDYTDDRINIDKEITKKFWCGNWRYTPHRHIIMSWMAKLDGTFSWHLKSTFEDLKDNVWFDIDETIKSRLEEGAKILESKIFSIEFDYCMEVSNPTDVYIPNHNAPRASLNFLESYLDCFCAVITETRFAQPTANFSEKTLIPLSLGIPFVLVAPPYTLEYLQKLGFKTFSQWWNEDYDQIENHTDRMMQIFEIIDFINSKSLDELVLMRREMQDVLEHNRNVMKEFRSNSVVL